MYFQLQDENKTVVNLNGVTRCLHDENLNNSNSNTYGYLYLGEVKFYYKLREVLTSDSAKIKAILLKPTLTSNIKQQGDKMFNDFKSFYTRNKDGFIFIAIILIVDYFLLNSVIRKRMTGVIQNGLGRIEDNLKEKKVTVVS